MKRKIRLAIIAALLSVSCILPSFATYPYVIGNTEYAITLDGTEYKTEISRPELSEYWFNYCMNDIIMNYSVAYIEEVATNTYNCHSYAWLPNHINHWYYDPSEFINDRHTQEISYNNVQNGDIVVYYDSFGMIQHSGIVVDADDMTIRSKWGASALLTHPIDAVPSTYLGFNNQLIVSFYRYPENHPYSCVDYGDPYYHMFYCSICGRDTYYDFHIPQIEYPEGMIRCGDCGYLFQD